MDHRGSRSLDRLRDRLTGDHEAVRSCRASRVLHRSGLDIHTDGNTRCRDADARDRVVLRLMRVGFEKDAAADFDVFAQRDLWLARNPERKGILANASSVGPHHGVAVNAETPANVAQLPRQQCVIATVRRLGDQNGKATGLHALAGGAPGEKRLFAEDCGVRAARRGAG